MVTARASWLVATVAAPFLLVETSRPQAAEPTRFVMDDYGWEVIPTEGMCTARAAFTGDEGLGVVELRKSGPSEVADVILIGQGLKKGAFNPHYRLTPADDPTDILSFSWIDAGAGRQGVSFPLSLVPLPGTEGTSGSNSPPSADPPARSAADRQQEQDSRFAEIDGIYVGGLFARSVVFQTGPITSVMRLMDRCTDRILESWSLSADTEKTLSRLVRPVDQVRWTRRIQSAQYPDLSQQLGTAVTIEYRLMIDAEGQVTDCITAPTTERVFAQTACERLREHARFEPALDAQGNPVPSYY